MMTARRGMRMLLAVLAPALVAPVLAVAPASAQTDATPRAAASYQTQAFAATNAQRAHHDRARLGHQPCVQHYAVRQARRMAERREMFHQDLRVVLRRCGLSMAGENVAYGYPNGVSVVRDGWMKSPDHRENLLRRGYRLLGIAARKAGDTWYVSQVFGTRA